ncbi:carbohydrate ABC transporter permease [Cryptosporangium phraense]|uniref:Sugar ABC transporter permease n=1 Tax=Cryptosporangium phraense TaxID=2593070 RepID=A0A545AUU9_9ACTN|nr:sugar ABC transporter permease [Cryptosporangium phraense]TQS45102.1 sugar ABC transporter permease [Cryptosporangium phraense]
MTSIATAPPPTPATEKRHRRRRRRPRPDSFLGATPFLAPAVVLYSVFLLFPIVSAVYLSFLRWNGFPTTPQKWAGLDNYAEIFTNDTVFYTALRNSVIWVVLSLIVPTVVALGLALALNRRLLGRNLIRSIFYIPAVLASIAVATMWAWMYNPNAGLINSVLTSLGGESLIQDWLGDPKIALYSVFVAFVWQTTGFSMVLFLAGLQSVPEELVEAARLDGANPRQVFRHVTLPALRPTLTVVLVLTVISSLKVFDLIVGMTGGGPAQSTQVLALWSYSQSFINHNFGAGNALAVVLLLITLALVLPYLLWTLKEDE